MLWVRRKKREKEILHVSSIFGIRMALMINSVVNADIDYIIISILKTILYLDSLQVVHYYVCLCPSVKRFPVAERLEKPRDLATTRFIVIILPHHGHYFQKIHMLPFLITNT